MGFKLHEVMEAEMTLNNLRRRGFIGKSQIRAMLSVLKSEEHQFMLDKIKEVSTTIETMPKTYQQDGLGQKAIVHLHYFFRGMDWHITEKDMEDEQLQAFGLADLGYGAELGYIWLGEITEAGAELDLYWTPKTLAEVKKG
jgi:hypothetical protein